MILMNINASRVRVVRMDIANHANEVNQAACVQGNNDYVIVDPC